MDIIYDSAHEEADVIFGTTTDEKIDNNSVKITIVATGFTQEGEIKTTIPANNTEAVSPEATVKTNIDMPSIGRQIKVSGGGYILEDDDLDYPTFLRRQMD
jgi:cell division protein FtsZ